jgi:hypothetical protein
MPHEQPRISENLTLGGDNQEKKKDKRNEGILKELPPDFSTGNLME